MGSPDLHDFHGLCDRIEPCLGEGELLTDTTVFPAIRMANTIYVEVQTSTWKTRGRLLWDAEAIEVRNAASATISRLTAALL